MHSAGCAGYAYITRRFPFDRYRSSSRACYLSAAIIYESARSVPVASGAEDIRGRTFAPVPRVTLAQQSGTEFLACIFMAGRQWEGQVPRGSAENIFLAYRSSDPTHSACATRDSSGNDDKPRFLACSLPASRISARYESFFMRAVRLNTAKLKRR